jgi:hypothetical protein
MVHHKEEAAFIRDLPTEAKFSPQQQSQVFRGNIARLLGI